MYTYGPVPSRRLGRSLGVSPIPHKYCTYNCVYCQLGRTDHQIDLRGSFYPRESVLAEIIKAAKNTKPDCITFVGDGEPTLSSDLGWLIDQTKSRLKIPLAVITNGSVIYRKDVSNDLAKADIIIPSLDAGNRRIFNGINRPHPSIEFDIVLQGLIDFNHDYTGKLWLEVMLISGKNDTDEELVSLKKSIEKIQPDRVYIMTPIRPPAEPWVKCPSPDRILKAQEMLGQAIAVSNLESGEFYLDEFENVRQAIKEIGSRHPLRLEQAEKMERAFSEPGTIEKMLKANELIKYKYNANMYLLPAHFLKSE